MGDRGLRRKNDAKKAIRKYHIAQEIYYGGYTAPLHYLSKGKIHCSCPICAAKTNRRVVKYGTCCRRGKNWAISDIRKIDSMEYKEKEYVA